MSTSAAKTSRSTARKLPKAAVKTASPVPARKKAANRATRPAAPPVASSPVQQAPAVAPRVKAAPAKAAKAPKTPKTPKVTKLEKHRVKLVRDSFAMPETDFSLIDVLKTRAIAAKRPAKKSELLRAGLKALAALTPTQLGVLLESLTPIKTGRPKKGH